MADWKPVVTQILRAVAVDVLKDVVKDVAGDPEGFALRAVSRLRLDAFADRLRYRKIRKRFALPGELVLWRRYARKLLDEVDDLASELATRPVPSHRLVVRTAIFDSPLRVQLTSTNVRDLTHGLDTEGADALKAACACMDEVARIVKELHFKPGGKDDEKDDAGAAKSDATDEHAPSRKYRDRLAERRDKLKSAARALIEAVDVLLPHDEGQIGETSPT